MRASPTDPVVAEGRVVLVDPALKDDRAGHHWKLNTGYARRIGPDRCWYAVHGRARLASGLNSDRVIRAFGTSFYDSAEQARLGSLGERLQSLAYRDHRFVPRGVRALVQAALAQRPRSQPGPTEAPLEPLYRAELARLIDTQGLTARDHLVFTSVDAQMGRAVLDLIVERGLSALPAVHLRLMYDDATVADGGLDYAGLVDRLAATGQLGAKLGLFCETQPHAEALSARLGVPVGLAPYPASPLPAPDPRAGRRLVIGFLGEARAEKGIDLVEPVIAAFDRRHPDLRDAVDWSIQAGGQTIEAARIRDRLRARRAGSAPNVHYHFGSMRPADYARRLAATDVILALQDPGVYALRGSGVAQEAVAGGRPLICRAGTSMAREAGAATLVADSIDGLADAVAEVVRHPDDWFRRAADAAKDYAARLATNDLVQACQAHAPSPTDPPVALIADIAGQIGDAAIRLNAHARALSSLGYQVVRLHLVESDKAAGQVLARALSGPGRDQWTVTSLVASLSRSGDTPWPATLGALLADERIGLWVSGSAGRRRPTSGRPDERIGLWVSGSAEAARWRDALLPRVERSVDLTGAEATDVRTWRRRLGRVGSASGDGSPPGANRV